MDVQIGRTYRLVPRGEHGLSCDGEGLALGGVALVWRSADPSLQYQVRSLDELSKVLGLAYGQQSPDAVQQRHRGLIRAAARLEAGDLALASIEAVMIGFPDLTPPAMAKLAKFADLEKAGDAWRTEPRIPAGQSGGGQWTTGGAEDDLGGADNAAAGDGDDTNDAGRPRPESASARGSKSLLDDGVFHPGKDEPVLVPTAGAQDADEGFRNGIGGNEPPTDFMSLLDVFPGLKDEPGVAILAPVDNFLNISGAADGANLAASEAEYSKLYNQILALDPTFRDEELQRQDQMSWQGRANAIDNLLMQRAATYYRVRGDIRPLQVETLRSLQKFANESYEQAVQEYNAGKLQVSLSREEAIGNRIDKLVRDRLKLTYQVARIAFGRSQNITINSRDVSSRDRSYRRPDARLGKVSFDWSLAIKTLSNAQIRGFFRADSEPDYVVIVRPSQLGQRATYLIRRPPGEIRKGELWDEELRTFLRELSVSLWTG
jgi:hypothetical protein